MTARIFKYVVSNRIWKLAMPTGAKILSVGADPATGNPAFWALVDDTQPKEEREFRVFGTGHEIDVPVDWYVGTAICGPFVWHVFEVKHG